MSEELKTTDETEELSRLIDEMNSGRQPECADKETADLLAVAALLRQSGGPVRPPQHILDQTVDRALAGIQAGKLKRSPTWWYSGALGTAAAVLLVVGLNLLPSWTRPVPSAVTPPAASSYPHTPQSQQDAAPAPAVSPAAPSQRVSPPAVATGPAGDNQTPANVPQPQGPPAAQAPPTAPAKPPDAAKSIPFMAERSSPQSQAKSSAPPSAPSAAPQTPPSTLAPLTLPGQAPDLVVTDKEKGLVRQIYHKSTPREITITQRLLRQEAGEIQREAKLPPALEAPAGDSGLVNKVTVTLFGQEVTIEGRQPTEELEKIAASLTP